MGQFGRQHSHVQPASHSFSFLYTRVRKFWNGGMDLVSQALYQVLYYKDIY